MVAHGKTSIGAYEAKTHFADLLRRVEAGEEFTITRNGKEIAHFLPAQSQSTEAQRAIAIAKIEELAKGNSLGGLKIKDLINEGPMIATFVLDCSITMAWCFPDEITPEISALLHRLQREACAVPPHWFLEVANVLALAERKGRHTMTRSATFIDQLRQMRISVDADTIVLVFDRILPLARQHRLTIYDAAYLDLALRRALPLATLDDDLRRAAAAAGVTLLGK